MEKKKGIIMSLVTSLILVTLILIGLTYAYYRTRIVENIGETSISVQSQKLEIVYADGNATFSTGDKDALIEPGFVYTKEFSVENTGDKLVTYDVIVDNVVNEFVKGLTATGNQKRDSYNDWKYNLELLTSTSGTTISNVDGEFTTDEIQVLKSAMDIEAKEKQSYKLTIRYVDLEDINQSADMGSRFSLRVNIQENSYKSVDVVANMGFLKNNFLVYDSNGDTAIVPEGFKIINENSVVNFNEEEKSSLLIEDGMIIEDQNGNQFVWVPVQDFSLFERTTQYNGVIKNNTLSTVEPAQEVFVSGKSGETTILSFENDLTNEYSEYNAMRNSVKKNKGFYIGRYEAGSATYRGECFEGSSELVIKKGSYPYRYVAWGESMTNVTDDIYSTTEYELCSGEINRGKGAVQLSREMYQNNSSVTSTLVYGVQYDYILTWLYDIENPFYTSLENPVKYVNNSIGMGWYCNNKENNLERLTGIDIENDLCIDGICNKVKNIYDLAGNVEEWTMETEGKYAKIHRGGNNSDIGHSLGLELCSKIDPDVEIEVRPGKYRSVNYPNVANASYGFRVALYIN